MKKEILKLALNGIDRKTLIANANAIIMSLGEHHITDALLFGIPKVTDINIKSYCHKNDCAIGIIGDIDIIDVKVNVIDNNVTVDVEYDCIRYTNADAINRFIKRDNYNRKTGSSYKSCVYWDDISKKATTKNNIPFFTKVKETYYISLDDSCVTYTR